MENVSIEKFWRSFAKSMIIVFAEQREDWFDECYAKAKKLTKYMDKVYQLIGKDLGYNVDEIEMEMKVKNGRLDCNFKKNSIIKVAIEHECNKKTWYEELIKLDKLDNNTTKILISYADWKKGNISRNTWINSIKEEVSFYIKKYNLSITGNFLFIFGAWWYSRDYNHLTGLKKQMFQAKAKEKFDYVAFYYNGKEFIDLEDVPITRELYKRFSS